MGALYATAPHVLTCADSHGNTSVTVKDMPANPTSDPEPGQILTLFDVKDAPALDGQERMRRPAKEVSPASLNKPNELIRIIASRGTKPLTLVQHRCFNSLLAEAQRQRVPGTVMPAFPVGTDLEPESVTHP